MNRPEIIYPKILGDDETLARNYAETIRRTKDLLGTTQEHSGELSSRTGTCTFNFPLKRRNSSDDDDSDESIGQPPTKQYISEDKVTAKFKEMSLSNIEPVNCTNDPPTRVLEDYELESDDEISNDSSIDDSNDNFKPTFILSDEIKQALNARNDRVERLFQDELTNSRKSLVLWQPPIGLLPPPLNVYKQEKTEEEKTNEIDPKSYELLDVDLNVPDNCVINANEMMDL